MYPLVMAVYRDYQRKVIGRDVLLETLERLQSLFLRKMVVGESRDHLAAQLCRRLKKSGTKSAGHDQVIREIVRRIVSRSLTSIYSTRCVTTMTSGQRQGEVVSRSRGVVVNASRSFVSEWDTCSFDRRNRSADSPRDSEEAALMTRSQWKPADERPTS